MPAKTTRKVTKTPSPAKAPPEKKASGTETPEAAKPPTPMTLLAAAELVLQESEFPMIVPRIMEEIEKRGLWSSPSGKTPQATLHAGISREISRKGDASRFRRVDKWFYGLTGKKYKGYPD